MKPFPRALMWICVVGSLGLCFDALHTVGKEAIALLMIAVPAIVGLCGVDRWRGGMTEK